MPTDRKRVAAYLYPEVEEKLSEYIKKMGVGESQAINLILAEYFGVSKSIFKLTNRSELRKIIREEVLKILDEET